MTEDRKRNLDLTLPDEYVYYCNTDGWRGQECDFVMIDEATDPPIVYQWKEDKKSFIVDSLTAMQSKMYQDMFKQQYMQQPFPTDAVETWHGTERYATVLTEQERVMCGFRIEDRTFYEMDGNRDLVLMDLTNEERRYLEAIRNARSPQQAKEIAEKQIRSMKGYNAIMQPGKMIPTPPEPLFNPAPEPVSAPKTFGQVMSDAMKKQQAIDQATNGAAGISRNMAGANGILDAMKQAGKVSTGPVVDTILDTDDFIMEDEEDENEDFDDMHPEGIFVAQVNLCTPRTDTNGSTYYDVEFETEHSEEFGYVNATAYSKMRGNFNIKVDHVAGGRVHVKVLR